MISSRDNEVITFRIQCSMKRRWAKQFWGMLKYMQQLGSMGSSRKVTFFADGDGDFRPTFHCIIGDIGEPAPGIDARETEIRPLEGDKFWDAG